MRVHQRIDTTDPRRHDRVKPYTIPDEWRVGMIISESLLWHYALTEEMDLYGALLASASVSSGAALLLRVPVIAYVGLIMSLAGVAHDKPLQPRRESMTGPYMSLSFSIMTCIMMMVQKMMGVTGTPFAFGAPKAVQATNA